MPKKPYILCAAYWHDSPEVYKSQPENIIHGYVTTGWRHDSCIIMHQLFCGEQPTGILGFLTSDNRFVDRARAAKIAFEAGQISTEVELLISEDLY